MRATARMILDAPESRQRTREGVMKLVGAIYEIASGRVRFLDVG